MVAEYTRGSHTVHDIKYHFVWATKYRYKILRGEMAKHLRELIRQGCEARGITIITGSVGHDHVYLLLSCSTDIAPSKIAQYLKGRSSRLLQESFPELKKRYWGQHLWARGYFCATVGSVTDEMVREYIANQEESSNETFKVAGERE
jgi:putative transposase